MCGRYSLEFDDEFYTRYRTANKLPSKPNYNVAPSQINPVITAHSPNQMEFMVWGLIPFWEQKNEKPHGLINVRDDTIIAKPWAHKYVESQRCLVPSTGFFEWKRTTSGKIPYYFHVKDGKYFSFAGIYSVYKSPKNGEEIKTYSIITTSPNSLMEPVHNRMPVILKKDDEQNWINPDLVEIDHLKEFLKPYPANHMEKYPISAYVNSPAHNDPSVLKPQKEEPAKTMFPTPDSK